MEEEIFILTYDSVENIVFVYTQDNFVEYQTVSSDFAEILKEQIDGEGEGEGG